MLRVDALLLTHLEAMGFTHVGFLLEERRARGVELVMREVLTVAGEATFASVVAEDGWDDVTLTTVLENNVAVVTALGPTKRMDWVDPRYDIEFITAAQSQTLSAIWGAHRLHLEQASARQRSTPRATGDRELFRALRVARRSAEQRVTRTFLAISALLGLLLAGGFLGVVDGVAAAQPSSITTGAALAAWGVLTLVAGLACLLLGALLLLNTTRIMMWASRGRLATQLRWPLPPDS
ncbi:MAG: hypothetical protein JNM17_07785 [Archangium sp.]|nr:hypothetical protein [Archangium sp.]